MKETKHIANNHNPKRPNKGKNIEYETSLLTLRSFRQWPLILVQNIS